jgi:choline dehydrogenase-like flavoprotein
MKDMVFQAYESAGVNWLPDCGTGEILGYCECTQNTYDGKRHYAANCYRLGTNVTTWTRTVAEKLIWEGKKVIGVVVIQTGTNGDGDKIEVFARKEVLVCSGVQGSAKLLLLR